MDMFSTIHVGNGALLENTIKLCEQAWGECDIHIITMDQETNKLRFEPQKLHDPMFGGFWFGRKTLGKIAWAAKQSAFMLLHIVNELTFKVPPGKLAFTNAQRDSIKAIEQADICVSSSGEMISDTFYQMLPFWLFTYWLATKKGKTLVLFPQSVGPLKMKWTRALVKWAIKDAFVLAGRDKLSCETLLSLGFAREKVMFVPDVAIRQDIGKADVHAYFTDRYKKVIGVTISSPPHREMGKPVNFVTEMCAQIKMLDPNQYKVLVMPSNYMLNGISADYVLCLALKECMEDQFEANILQNRSYFPDEYAALLSQLEFFISTRMHVSILATSIGTPTIAINTQHKIRAYMENIGMEYFCVDYSEMSRITTLTQEITSQRSKISEKLKTANKMLRQKHTPFIEKLKQIIVVQS